MAWRREPHRSVRLPLIIRLADSGVAWERLKIGGGTPPILSRHGWLIVYHGRVEWRSRATLDTNCATRLG